jgi:hypothetical protein
MPEGFLCRTYDLQGHPLSLAGEPTDVNSQLRSWSIPLTAIDATAQIHAGEDALGEPWRGTPGKILAETPDYFAKSWPRSANALNSSALAAGSRKNIVARSPTSS